MSFEAGDVEEAIEDAMEQYADDWGGVWGGVQEEDWESAARPLRVNGETVQIKLVEISTGTYDDDTYMIFEVTTSDFKTRHFRKFGWTASHDGTYWEGSFDEVTPEQKTITVWRRKR